jgi:hypothetical protein
MEMTEAGHTKQYFNLGGGMDGCCGGWGGGNGLFTILLLFFLFGSGNGFGGWGNNRGPLGADLAVNSAASIAKNEAGLDYLGQTIAGQGAKLDSIVNSIGLNTAALQNALCQGFGGLNTAVLNSKYDITRSIDQCCCNTQQSIAALAAGLDKATCAIITAGKDNTQAILSALCNHWRENDNRIICKLEQELNAQNIIAALKN